MILMKSPLIPLATLNEFGTINMVANRLQKLANRYFKIQISSKNTLDETDNLIIPIGLNL